MPSHLQEYAGLIKQPLGPHHQEDLIGGELNAKTWQLIQDHTVRNPDLPEEYKEYFRTCFPKLAHNEMPTDRQGNAISSNSTSIWIPNLKNPKLLEKLNRRKFSLYTPFVHGHGYGLCTTSAKYFGTEARLQMNQNPRQFRYGYKLYGSQENNYDTVKMFGKHSSGGYRYTFGVGYTPECRVSLGKNQSTIRDNVWVFANNMVGDDYDKMCEIQSEALQFKFPNGGRQMNDAFSYVPNVALLMVTHTPSDFHEYWTGPLRLNKGTDSMYDILGFPSQNRGWGDLLRESDAKGISRFKTRGVEFETKVRPHLTAEEIKTLSWFTYNVAHPDGEPTQQDTDEVIRILGYVMGNHDKMNYMDGIHQVLRLLPTKECCRIVCYTISCWDAFVNWCDGKKNFKPIEQTRTEIEHILKTRLAQLNKEDDKMLSVLEKKICALKSKILRLADDLAMEKNTSGANKAKLAKATAKRAAILTVKSHPTLLKDLLEWKKLCQSEFDYAIHESLRALGPEDVTPKPVPEPILITREKLNEEEKHEEAETSPKSVEDNLERETQSVDKHDSPEKGAATSASSDKA